MRVKLNFDLLPDDLKDNPIYSVIVLVQRMFEIIIRKSTQNLRETDMIRLLMNSDELDKPVSTCLMPVSELTVEKVVAALVIVLQSKDEIRLDTGFNIDVITIRKDVGAGKFRKITNIEIDRLRKKSILAIPFDEQGLCCAKAIVYGLAHLEGDRTAIDAMRRRNRPALLKRAIKLHEDADVPLGPCTYAEISKFESFLNVQIVVISSENLNKVNTKVFLLKIFFLKSFI